MKHARIKARFPKYKKTFALPPPIHLLMGDGRVEEIKIPHQDILGFTIELLRRPLSREVDLICERAAILQQPGHLMEVVAAVIDHPRAVLRGEFTPEIVELGLCTREQYCGIEPQSPEDLRAKKREVYGEN